MSVNLAPRFGGLFIAEMSPLSGPTGGESLKLVVHATNDKKGKHLDQFQLLFGPTKETGLDGKTTEAQSFTISGELFPGGKNLLYKGKKVMVNASPEEVRPLIEALLKKLPGLDAKFKQHLGQAINGFYNNIALYKILYGNK